jgi:hypothetical protein
MIYMFASRRDGRVYGFTNSPKGSNLPVEFAPWQPLGAQVMSGAGGAESVTEVEAAISAKGHYVARRDPPKEPSH